jgi:hypothetical protein
MPPGLHESCAHGVGAADPWATGVGPAVAGTDDGEDEAPGDDELPAVGAAEDGADGPDAPGLAGVLGCADPEAGACGPGC